MKELIKSITKKEWHFLALVSLILVVIIFAPTIYAVLITPEGQQFTGLKMPNAGDYWVFFSRIEQSRQGNIFHQFLYSGEPLPRVLFFPAWTIMGLVGGALTLSSQQTFYFFQLILIPLLVLSLYILIGKLIRDQIWKRVTLIVILFTTGSDWLFWSVFKKSFGWLGLDLNLPDTHVITAAFHSPHLIFFLIFICWLFICLFQLNQTRKIKFSWWMGLLSMLLFLSHPFQVIPILGTMAIYYFYKIIIKKKYWLIKKLIPFFIFNLIIGIYLFFLWSNFEVIRSWNIKNLAGGYHRLGSIFLLLSTFSIFFLLAIYKIWQLIREKKIENYTFLLIWLVVGLISIYLPIQWRGKMILGLSIPITILGCLGLKQFWQKIHPLFMRLAAIWLIILLTLPSGLYLIGYNFHIYNKYSQVTDSEHYFSKDLITGLTWLRNIPDNSIILSLPVYNIMIPSYAGRKVYAGFLYETLNYQEKFAESIEFFEGRRGQEFLEKNKINYIFTDNSLKSFERDYLEMVFNNQITQIYKVKE